jgi:hypothetical protein
MRSVDRASIHTQKRNGAILLLTISRNLDHVVRLNDGVNVCLIIQMLFPFI